MKEIDLFMSLQVTDEGLTEEEEVNDDIKDDADVTGNDFSLLNMLRDICPVGWIDLLWFVLSSSC